MEKVELNKMECRYPILFKVMWLAVVVLMVVGIANYFGHWLSPDKLDDFGMSVLFLFGVAMICCFGKALLNLILKHGILAIDVTTKRVASYAFLLFFSVLMIISIWEICSTTNNYSGFVRNGTLISIPTKTVFAIVCDIIKATMFSVCIALSYWYIRMCFILFSGRIRRIGIEIVLALMMLAFLSVRMSNQLWVNAVVVLIASSFLYDIWRFADFREEQFHMNWIKKHAEEEE